MPFASVLQLIDQPIVHAANIDYAPHDGPNHLVPDASACGAAAHHSPCSKYRLSSSIMALITSYLVLQLVAREGKSPMINTCVLRLASALPPPCLRLASRAPAAQTAAIYSFAKRCDRPLSAFVRPRMPHEPRYGTHSNYGGSPRSGGTRSRNTPRTTVASARSSRAAAY